MPSDLDPPDAPADPGPAFHQERTIRPLPIAFAVAGGVLILVAGLLVAGIAGKSAPAASTPFPSRPSVVAAAPSPSATPAVTPPARAPGPNECVDATGEGGPVDLKSVSLSLTKGVLVARFELVDALPAGASSVGIYATSRDGKRSYQLAASWRDRKLDTFNVHDFERDRDTKLNPRDIEVDGSAITAAFPGDFTKSLGAGWGWYAFSTANGRDVDACPGDPLAFHTITFDPGTGDNNGDQN